MASVKLAYGASSALTITQASLGTSSGLVAGRQSAVVDNSANLYEDYLLSATTMTGSTPTTGKEIQIWVVSILDDSVWPDGFGASDAARTITTVDILNGYGAMAWRVTTNNTSNQPYPMRPTSVAALFGGALPMKWVTWQVHNTGVNLNSTGGNHAMYIKPIYRTVS